MEQIISQHTDSIVNLSHLGLLKISGAKTKDLLQGQLTCDINEITPAQTRLGAHCNPQGRIISLFRLFQMQDDYYLQMPRTMVPIALNALKKYAIFFKVELSDVSAEWIKLGLLGVIHDKEKFPTTVDEAKLNEDTFVIKLPGNKFELISKSPKLFTPANTLSSWELSDIQLGYAMIHPETSEKFLPHELNLHQLNAISFKKGCYTGQEVIARMQYRAKLKKQLHLAISVSTPVERGLDIFTPEGPAGKVVDFVDNSLLILTHETNIPLFMDQGCTQPITIKQVNHVN